MAVVVSFYDYTPPPRFDGLPYTEIQITEAQYFEGNGAYPNWTPYNLIDTQVLAPVDPNPAQPLSRSFTTQLGTIDNGWYIVIWVDAAGHQVPTDPIRNQTQAVLSFTPSIAQIAQNILSRTKDQFGNIQGNFTSTTTPNNVQAAQFATEAADELSLVIGDYIRGPLIVDAQRVAALKASMEIELAFFPDQVNTGRSIFPQLEDRYEAQMKHLQRQVDLMKEGEHRVGDPGPTLRPSFRFPRSMVYLGTPYLMEDWDLF